VVLQSLLFKLLGRFLGDVAVAVSNSDPKAPFPLIGRVAVLKSTNSDSKAPFPLIGLVAVLKSTVSCLATQGRGKEPSCRMQDM
jgi:hypothetical protein